MSNRHLSREREYAVALLIDVRRRCGNKQLSAITGLSSSSNFSRIVRRVDARLPADLPRLLRAAADAVENGWGKP